MYHIMQDELSEQIIDNITDVRSTAKINIIEKNYPISKDASSSNDNIECPICLENIIFTDPVLILDCCSKTVHLTCIIGWYSKHQTNKTCIMCNQSNNFCQDLVYNENQSYSNTPQLTNSSIIEVSDTDIQNVGNMEINMRYRCTAISSIIFVVICLVLTFVMIF